MKVAIVYDRVNKWGGAERVLLALNELFPQAPLYTSVYSEKDATWAKKFPKVVPSFLQRLPLFQTKHDKIPFLMPLAFESLNFKNYDLVISVTSEAAKGIITSNSTKHVCYCLTPTRYLWSGYKDYFPTKLKKSLAHPAVAYLRAWDKMAAGRPDQMIAISKAVQKRIKKYYHRKSEIINPPVDILKFKPKSAEKKFFLIVSRLVPYKKVDLAVEVFNELGLPLVIVGTGSEESKLKQKAKRNIHFLSKLTDSQLSQYYNNAKAFIMPQHEDFGITAVEAQTTGVPVLAFKRGGARDIIKDKETGILFDKQTPEALKYALQEFSHMKFDTAKMFKNANRFSKENFQKNFLNYINKVL